ncbi:MAG: O-antigen ligase family protein [Candidatus Acidiferrum sp.]
MLMLLYTTGAMMPFLGSSGSTTAANKYEIAVQIPLYAVAACFILLHWRNFRKAAWGVQWILALVALAVVSTAWSEVPLFTLRRGIILIATTAFGIYFATRFDVTEQLRILARVCATAVCASFLFGFFLPQYGLDPTFQNHSWRGIFAQKNSLGRFAVLSVVVFLLVRPRAGRWLACAGVAASLVLLLFSKSVTSVLVCGLILGMQVVFKLFRTRFTFAVPVFCFAAAFLALVTLGGDLTPARVLHLLHRDLGMTGRARLWALSWTAIVRKPWLGYGFKSFWLGMNGASATLVQQLHWAAPTAHNGLLDVTLELGALGLALFLIGYFALWQRALQFLNREHSRTPVWLCTYMFFMLAYNFSERTILEQNTIYWVLYAATAVNLYLDLPCQAQVTEPQANSAFEASVSTECRA